MLAPLLFAALAPLCALAAPPQWSQWPQPQTLTTGATSVGLAPGFTIECAGSLCPAPLASAFARYALIFFIDGPPAAAPSGPSLTGVDVVVGADAPLALFVSENYTLSVPSGGRAVITADTQWGALRALETFSQLITWSSDARTGAPSYAIPSTPISVDDFPRFPWRGVLIDSSRHFLTVAAIHTVLDAMSFNKMNRLHFHVVDDNS